MGDFDEEEYKREHGLRLLWGYNQGLPENAKVAWGGRAILKWDKIDLPFDRQDMMGTEEERRELLSALNKADKKIRKKIAEICPDPRVAEEYVFYDDGKMRVLGNTQGSHGYLYMVAYLIPSKEGE